MDNKLISVKGLTIDKAVLKELAVSKTFSNKNTDKTYWLPREYAIKQVIEGVNVTIKVTATQEQLDKLLEKKKVAKKVANDQPSKSDILAQIQALAKIVEGMA